VKKDSKTKREVILATTIVKAIMGFLIFSDIISICFILLRQVELQGLSESPIWLHCVTRLMLDNFWVM
jgi:hypothetical protein